MFTLRHGLLLLLCVILPANRVWAVQTDVRIDTGQADAVLAILGGADQWSLLWKTEGYVRLKKRDSEMGRAFTDSEFREFVESADLKARRSALSTTLSAWKQADMESIGQRVGSYLPKGAELKATVYIVIKPRSNSFVYELSTNPAIFLYLDPGKTRAQFENTGCRESARWPLANSLSVSKRWNDSWCASLCGGFMSAYSACLLWRASRWTRACSRCGTVLKDAVMADFLHRDTHRNENCSLGSNRAITGAAQNEH